MGFVHIYFGDGKGKTTAAAGLAIRCAGNGGKVFFSQFMKKGDSSELNILGHLKNITVYSGYAMKKFSFLMNDDELRETGVAYTKQLEKTLDIMKKSNYNMIILDEVLNCISTGIFEEKLLVSFLENVKADTEIVLTGRNASEKICEYADYISEIKKVKHPFDKGVTARKGIEY